MLFIFSTPGLISHQWQLKTVVSLRWFLICALPLFAYKKSNKFMGEMQQCAKSLDILENT
jgi:hypothetical protein